MTIINGCPVPQQVWHAKEPSGPNGHKCRARQNLQPFDGNGDAFIVKHSRVGRKTSNKQTNKQTNKLILSIVGSLSCHTCSDTVPRWDFYVFEETPFTMSRGLWGSPRNNSEGWYRISLVFEYIWSMVDWLGFYAVSAIFQPCKRLYIAQQM